MAMLSKIAKMKLYIIIHFLRQGFFIFLTINITIGFLFGSLNENKVIMLNGIRILIVEDDKLNQKIIHYILQKKGAIFEMAFNGNEAIELLSKNKFDIILMDLQMPGMNGYNTTEYIRKNMKINIPVIALTADPFAAKTDQFIESGINAFICKPVDPNNLFKLILSFINENRN